MSKIRPLSTQFQKLLSDYRKVEERYANMSEDERADAKAMRGMVREWLDVFMDSNLITVGNSIPYLLYEALGAADDGETTLLFATRPDDRGRRKSDWRLNNLKGQAGAILEYGCTVHGKPCVQLATQIADVMYGNGVGGGIKNAPGPYSERAIRGFRSRGLAGGDNRIAHSFRINTEQIRRLNWDLDEALSMLAYMCADFVGQQSGRNRVGSSASNG